METLRELLIKSVHSDSAAREFFESNLGNQEILNLLVECARDDYSNDARMEASYWISNFDIDCLKTVENKLLEIQKDELDSIACLIFVALGKLKSKEGLRYLIESRIAPVLHWEAEALKHHLKESFE